MQLVVDGPYGTCTPVKTNGSNNAVNGYYSAFGDIPYSNDDYCWLATVADGTQPPACTVGPGCEPSEAGGNFELVLPYKSDESHLDHPFTVSARWRCTSLLIPPPRPPDPLYQCTSTRTFQFTVQRNTNEDGQDPSPVSGNYTFSQGELVPIAEFDGRGHCKLLIPPVGTAATVAAAVSKQRMRYGRNPTRGEAMSGVSAGFRDGIGDTMSTITSAAEAARHELGWKFGGKLIGPQDPGYDQARTVHNAMIDRRPALIARCRDSADVARADHDRPGGSA